MYSTKEMQYGIEEGDSSARNADAFFNFSGPSSVEESMRNPKYYLEAPLKQVKFQLAELSKLDFPPHYVFVSSASVYGNTEFLYPQENSKVSPISPYAEGKLVVENFLLSEMKNYAGGITILRATSLYAENLNSRVLGRIRSQLQMGHDFDLYGDGSERRDFLHVSDFLHVARMLSQQGGSEKGVNVFNVGSGIATSMRDLLDTAILHSPYSRPGTKVSFNKMSRPGDPHTISVSIEKLCAQIGLNQLNFKDKLHEYFAERNF